MIEAGTHNLTIQAYDIAGNYISITIYVILEIIVIPEFVSEAFSLIFVMYLSMYYLLIPFRKNRG